MVLVSGIQGRSTAVESSVNEKQRAWTILIDLYFVRFISSRMDGENYLSRE